MPNYRNARPKAGESEYTGRMGRSTTGIPEDRPEAALSAADEARLLRISDRNDEGRRFNERIWHGEAPEKSARQIEGELRS
jgi:hypothetical protein